MENNDRLKHKYNLIENSAQESQYMNSTLPKDNDNDRDELLKSPKRIASRNCLKKSSSYVKKHQNDNNNSKYSNSIIQISNKDSKQVLSSQNSNITNLRDKIQASDVRDSQKRKNN